MSYWVTDDVPEKKYREFINYLNEMKQIRIQKELQQIQTYKKNYDIVVKQIRIQNELQQIQTNKKIYDIVVKQFKYINISSVINKKNYNNNIFTTTIIKYFHDYFKI
jgi:hypothetical protein